MVRKAIPFRSDLECPRDVPQRTLEVVQKSCLHHFIFSISIPQSDYLCYLISNIENYMTISTEVHLLEQNYIILYPKAIILFNGIFIDFIIKNKEHYHSNKKQ